MLILGSTYLSGAMFSHYFLFLSILVFFIDWKIMHSIIKLHLLSEVAPEETFIKDVDAKKSPKEILQLWIINI